MDKGIFTSLKEKALNIHLNKGQWNIHLYSSCMEKCGFGGKGHFKIAVSAAKIRFLSFSQFGG